MREYRAKGSAHSAKEKCRQGERGWKPVRLSLNVVAGFFFSGDIPGKGKSASVKATEPSVPHQNLVGWRFLLRQIKAMSLPVKGWICFRVCIQDERACM